MTAPKLSIQVVVSDMFEENAFIAYLEGRDDCVIFDPGLNPERIIEAVEKIGRIPASILNTHGHSDHIAGNQALKDKWPDIPLVIGHGDAHKLTDPKENLSAGYGVSIISPPADETVKEGDVYSSAGLELEVLETPGHSIGHVVFVWKGGPQVVVFGGDVLFRQGVGRTDFPDGNQEDLMISIRTKLYTLPDDTIVLTGHGEATQIGFEKKHNPFVRGE
ncbi:MAG: hydroxyacylglutathione hydrolase [Pirellulaceae bacterium]